MYVCSHGHVCADVYTCVSMHVELEISFGCYSSADTHLVSRDRVLLGPGLTDWLGGQASGDEVYFFSTWITEIYHTADSFTWVPGLKLRSSCFQSKHFTV